MKRFLTVLTLYLLIAISVQAQNTSVSATVTDAGSVVWANGTYSFNFVPSTNAPNGPFFNNGVPYTPTTLSGSLNGSGAFTQSVPSNSTITPSGSFWIVTYCPQATAACQNSGKLTITGGSQNISASFIPAALVVQPGANQTVYNTNEVGTSIVGSQIYLIGTGLETCSAVTGTVCNTWVSGGGGGITQVSSLPATCTPSTSAPVQLTVAPFTVYICTATNVWSGTPPAGNAIYPAAYGVVADGKMCSDATISGTSVTSAGNCTWTAADVGKELLGYVQCDDNMLTTATARFPAGTTISAFVSAHSITASNSGSAGACIRYGTNNDATYDLVDAAVAASTTCPIVLLDSGFSIMDRPHLGQFTSTQISGGPTSCSQMGPSANRGAGLGQLYTIRGKGAGASGFWLGHGFAANMAANCIYGSVNTACWCIPSNAEWSNFQIDGGADTLSGSTPGTHSLIQMMNYSLMDYVYLHNYGISSSSTNVGLEMRSAAGAGGGPEYLDHVNIDGFGTTNSAASGSVYGSFVNMQDYVGTSFTVASGENVVFSGGHNVFEAGLATAAFSPQITFGGATFWGTGLTVNGGNGATNGQFGMVISSGIVWIDDSRFLNNTGTSVGEAFENNGGTLHLHNSTVSWDSSGSGRAYISLTASSVLYDDCGNSVTAPVKIFIPSPGVLTGPCAANGAFAGPLINTTPVTVNANVSTAQLLQAITLAPGVFNVVGKTINISTAGVYSTPGASTATITLTLNLCTVSGCGSGTVVPLATWTSGANPGTITTNPMGFNVTCIPTAAGATATFECHGQMAIDLGATAGLANTIYSDTNTAVSSAIDATNQLFLQVTGTFSAASASNVFTDRQTKVTVQ